MAKEHTHQHPQDVTSSSGGSNGQAPYRLAIIPVGKIRRNSVALRDVDKETEEYRQLADSVKKRGVLLPIMVREFENPDVKGEILFGLIDGLQRYNAALDGGLTEIPAKITDMDQADIEETQIVANATRIVTKPIEFANAIDRLLQRNPTLSMQELGDRLSQTAAWLYKILGMAKKLHPDIKPMVDEKKIVLSNAIELSKLPQEEQPEWVDKAMTMAPGEFTANVAARIKTVKDERRKGRKEAPPTFEPVPHNRKWADIKAEYLNGCPNILAMLRRQNVTDPEEAAKMTVAWASMMDPDSQTQQREENEARKKKDAAEADRKKLEREKQKEEEARKTRLELEKKVAERAKTPETAGV